MLHFEGENLEAKPETFYEDETKMKNCIVKVIDFGYLV